MHILLEFWPKRVFFIFFMSFFLKIKEFYLFLRLQNRIDNIEDILHHMIKHHISYLTILTIAVLLLASCKSEPKRVALFETGYEEQPYDDAEEAPCDEVKEEEPHVDTVAIGSFSDDMEVSVPETNDRYEIPRTQPGVPDNFISHTGFALSFNTSTNLPNWVAWELTSSELEDNVARSNDYQEDPAVPSGHRVSPYICRDTPFDRGHMCPAGDMHWSAKAMADCFYMSNICPQSCQLNQVWWERLENACRRWARRYGSVYICCGPIYDGNVQHIGSSPSVAVPSGFFKVVLMLRPGQEKAIGFIYKNDDSRQPMGQAACSVDDVEKLTGLDFFPMVADTIENNIESSFNLRIWN